MDLDEYFNKRGITPESRARIDAHKKRMMLLLEHTPLPQNTKEHETPSQ